MTELIENICNTYIDGMLHRDYYRSGGARYDVFRAAILSEGPDYAPALARAYVPDSEYSPELKAPPLTWSAALALGIDPILAHETGIPIHVTVSADHSVSCPDINHPLNIGMMHLRCLNDESSAKRCIAEYVTIIEDFNNRAHKEQSANAGRSRHKYSSEHFNKDGSSKASDYYGSGRFWAPSFYSPDPAQYGIAYRIDKPHASFDNVALAPWFSDQGLQRILASNANTQVMADVLAYTGKAAKDLLHTSAAQALRLEWSRSARRTDYINMVTLLRLCDRGTAETMLSEARGVHEVLGIARRDAPSALMVKALSALAQSTLVCELSPYYGRAPTVDELVAVRSKKLVELLYYMPVPILREVLDEEQAEERIRARLFRELGKAETGTLRSALAAHDKRKPLAPYPLLDRPVPRRVMGGHTEPEITTYSWDLVFSGLGKQYLASRAYRSQLQKLVPSAAARIAATMSLYSSNPYVTNSLKTQGWWAPVADLLQGTKKPDEDPTELVK